MRIGGGSLKGRRLSAPPGKAVRPTSDRAREALFNRLVHGAFSDDGGSSVADAFVLDVFCGTGALGLEALSRGAAHAYFLDNDSQSIACLHENIQAFELGNHTTVMQADATRPPPAIRACSLVFLDAPYTSDLTGPALSSLSDAGWIAAGALCMAEAQNNGASFETPAGFDRMDQRAYGKAQFSFLKHQARLP